MLNLNDINDSDLVSTTKILSKLTDDQIFSYYVGDYSRSMCSPLRKDSVPSFSVYHSSLHNKLYYKDHATGDFGDCFDIVRQLFQTSLIGACAIINNDFELGFRNPDNIEKIPPTRAIAKSNVILPKTKELGCKFRPWYQCDTDFWTARYGLTEQQLAYYNVRPVHSVFLGDDVITRGSVKDPIYAYIFYKDGNYTYKIYRPLTDDKKHKWMSSTNKTVLQGWDQLPPKGDLLILTKALKDVMVYRTFGYYAIACQNEVSIVKDTVMDELKSRFKHIVVNQDQDEAGILGTETLCNLYDLPHYYLDIENEAKDISDYRAAFGEKKTELLIKTKLNEIFRQ